MKIRKFLKRLALDVILTLLLLTVIVGVLLFFMIPMPGTSFQGKVPPLDAVAMKLQQQLETHINQLASSQRNLQDQKHLTAAKNYIIDTLTQYGYQVDVQSYQIETDEFANLVVNITGQTKPNEILIIGAHYDSITDSPGANDNASGVAALLAIADSLQGQKLARTVQLIAFANEEPPYFYTEHMGSLVYATQAANQQADIIGMISLETIGYYTDAPNSQKYPPPFNYFYPNQGNFVGFIGNLSSRQLVRNAIDIFRQHATIPSEGLAAPVAVPGVGASDQWSFWQYNYPAMMVTDTAPFRYPYYHTTYDTPDRINYEGLTRTVIGLREVVKTLANQ